MEVVLAGQAQGSKLTNHRVLQTAYLCVGQLGKVGQRHAQQSPGVLHAGCHDGSLHVVRYLLERKRRQDCDRLTQHVGERAQCPQPLSFGWVQVLERQHVVLGRQLPIHHLAVNVHANGVGFFQVIAAQVFGLANVLQ